MEAEHSSRQYLRSIYETSGLVQGAAASSTATAETGFPAQGVAVLARNRARARERERERERERGGERGGDIADLATLLNRLFPFKLWLAFPCQDGS